MYAPPVSHCCFIKRFLTILYQESQFELDFQMKTKTIKIHWIFFLLSNYHGDSASTRANYDFIYSKMVH